MQKRKLMEKARKIKLFAMDVDGVLTDGKIIYDSDGREIKHFNVKDGLGIKLLRKAGIKTAIITSRDSFPVEKRARELKIDFLYQSVKNKIAIIDEIREKLFLSYDEIAYIGDDLVDIPLLKRVGFPVSVPSSPEIVKRYCVYITKKNGGDGAVRETVEYILKLRNEYTEAIKEYLI